MTRLTQPLRVLSLVVVGLLTACPAPEAVPVDPSPDASEDTDQVDSDQGDSAQDDAGDTEDTADTDASEDDPSLAITPEGMERAADYSAAAGGIAVLVWQDGEVIFERYDNGGDADTAPHIYSATKAFWAAGLAAARQDGLITDLDEPVVETITEWQDGATHPGKDAITLRQLTTLSSGLSQDFLRIGPEPRVDDIYQYVIDDLNLVNTPGESFSYGPSQYYVFAVVLDRKLQAAGFDNGPLAWLDERILDPMGLSYDDWLHDNAGNPHIPNGAYLNARELLKFGIFLLRRGAPDDQAIIDAPYIDDLLIADGPNQGHGRFLWINDPAGHGVSASDRSPPGSPGGFLYHQGLPTMFAGLGRGRNGVYILPEEEAVIVRLTIEDHTEFIDHEFFSHLFSE